MFLGFLSDDEKRAFAGLAGRMIEADGIAVPAEKVALTTLRRELGITVSEASEADPAELATVFGSRRAKVAALLELIGLGYSDSGYSVEENAFVSEVAKTMGVSSDEIGRLEAWVKEHVRLVENALSLMQD